MQITHKENRGTNLDVMKVSCLCLPSRKPFGAFVWPGEEGSDRKERSSSAFRSSSGQHSWARPTRSTLTCSTGTDTVECTITDYLNPRKDLRTWNFILRHCDNECYSEMHDQLIKCTKTCINYMSDLFFHALKMHDRNTLTISRSVSMSSVWKGENHRVFSCSSRASDRMKTVLQTQTHTDTKKVYIFHLSGPWCPV